MQSVCIVLEDHRCGIMIFLAVLDLESHTGYNSRLGKWSQWPSKPIVKLNAAHHRLMFPWKSSSCSGQAHTGLGSKPAVSPTDTDRDESCGRTQSGLVTGRKWNLFKRQLLVPPLNPLPHRTSRRDSVSLDMSTLTVKTQAAQRVTTSVQSQRVGHQAWDWD